MDKLISEHALAISQLEAQCKDSITQAKVLQDQADTDRHTLETQYRERLASLQAECEAQAEKNAKNSDDLTEKMQKELEDLQIQWNQEQKNQTEKLHKELQEQWLDIQESHEKRMLEKVT